MPEVIEHELQCVSYSYNLRGLNVSSNCPECGVAVVRSVVFGFPAAVSDPNTDELRISCWNAVAIRAGFPADAIAFVRDALSELVPMSMFWLTNARAADLDPLDVCQAVVSYALDFFGEPAEAQAVLSDWQIRDSKDVGRILNAMADAGFVLRAESDELARFDGSLSIDRLLQSDWGEREEKRQLNGRQ